MFLSLVSGSSGNATLVSDGNTKLLVDCGMSQKKLCAALSLIGISPEELDGLLITHEHSDHIKGAGIVSKKYNLPVFATLKTHEAMEAGFIADKNIRYITPDIDFEIGTIGITPFSIPHDAANPVGYNFFFGDKKLSLATDIGKMNDYVFEHLKGSLAVLLESNHDIDMLKKGRYPAFLKNRILGEFGHLSNDDAAKTVLSLAQSGTSYVMLGHLSNENNTPTLAYTKTAEILAQNGAILDKDVSLSVAARYEVSRFK